MVLPGPRRASPRSGGGRGGRVSQGVRDQSARPAGRGRAGGGSSGLGGRRQPRRGAGRGPALRSSLPSGRTRRSYAAHSAMIRRAAFGLALLLGEWVTTAPAVGQSAAPAPTRAPAIRVSVVGCVRLDPARVEQLLRMELSTLGPSPEPLVIEVQCVNATARVALLEPSGTTAVRETPLSAADPER